MRKIAIPTKGEEISSLFIGDVMFGGEYEKYVNMHNVDYSYAFSRVEKIFNEADVVFCNLENPLFKIGRMRERDSILYAPPESISALKAINCRIINIGNNHINDYGDESLIKTKQYLEEYGFITIGSGEDITEASEPKIIDIRGVKIGFLSFTTSSTDPEVTSIIATKNTAGCASFDDISFVLKKIRGLKKKVDYLVISLHWGYQLYYYPSPEQTAMARKMIDEGADVIVGPHPHVIQGVENYKQGIIFYSLGNFFFPDFLKKSGSIRRWDEDDRKSFVAKLYLNSKRQMRYSLIPFTSDNFMVVSLSPEKKEFEKDILSLSNGIKNENYRQFWDLYRKRWKRDKIYKAKRRLFETLTSSGIKNIIRKISIKGLVHVSVLILKCYIFKIQDWIQKILKRSNIERGL